MNQPNDKIEPSDGNDQKNDVIRKLKEILTQVSPGFYSFTTYQGDFAGLNQILCCAIPEVDHLQGVELIESANKWCIVADGGSMPGQVGSQQPGLAAFQQPNHGSHLWQTNFDGLVPDGQSPSDTSWSSGSAPGQPVPNTLNVEDW